MLLEGRVAIVTGIGPGMGRSIALRFAREGASLALAARRAESLESVAREVEALGRPALAQATDISDRASCARLVDAALQRFGGVDILVQNGHLDGDYRPIADSDPESWRQSFEVNLMGSLHLAQLLVPTMRQRGGGRMVFINSGASSTPPPTLGPYAATKAALASLVRSLAAELGPHGIRANSVQLGPVDGDNYRRHAQARATREQRSLEAVLADAAALLPLRYLPPPDECAGAVLFFASDLSRCITGQTLPVNGGQWFN